MAPEETLLSWDPKRLSFWRMWLEGFKHATLDMDEASVCVHLRVLKSGIRLQFPEDPKIDPTSTPEATPHRPQRSTPDRPTLHRPDIDPHSDPKPNDRPSNGPTDRPADPPPYRPTAPP